MEVISETIMREVLIDFRIVLSRVKIRVQCRTVLQANKQSDIYSTVSHPVVAGTVHTVTKYCRRRCAKVNSRQNRTTNTRQTERW